MHIANGIIDGPVAAAFAALAVAALAFCVPARPAATSTTGWRRWPAWSRRSSSPSRCSTSRCCRGVSGHLLGGALAAMLVGPWVGALCVSVVLVVQALVFADGGVTALGLNITNMALLGTAAGYLLIVGAAAGAAAHAAGLGHRRVRRLAWSAWSSPSQGFVLQYALGGATTLASRLGAISAAMAGVARC